MKTGSDDRTQQSAGGDVKQGYHILVVEDDRLIARIMMDTLSGEGYMVTGASDGKEGTLVIRKTKPDIIITDLVMPGMDGFEFIRWLREKNPTIPIIVVSGRRDFQTIHSIIKFWVYDYLVKPVDPEDLIWCVMGAVKKLEGSKREERYIQSLERQVEAQAEKTRFLFYEAVQSLVNALEAKDRYTQGHSLRVTRLATYLSEELGLSETETSKVTLASQLHDIGKLAISDQILNKKSRLTDEEYALIKQHPVAGHRILDPILHDSSLTAVLHHHEHFNGGGYPKGLSGEKIPMEARIISIADAFDAMTSDRAYRKNIPREDACREIKRCSGKQFDPEITGKFLAIAREV